MKNGILGRKEEYLCMEVVDEGKPRGCRLIACLVIKSKITSFPNAGSEKTKRKVTCTKPHSRRIAQASKIIIKERTSI
jgi:hypothetical protein